jgi:hypothetical protein
MGVIASLLASAKSISVVPRSAAARDLSELLQLVGDFTLPTSLAAANEVQSIAQYGGTVTSGTFALTITLLGGQTFTTAGIAYNAIAATIQTAIDVAATAAAIPGWVNGSIVVAGGPLTTGAATLTFSGVVVSNRNHPLATINGASLVGGTAGAISTTTDGQSDRLGWACLQRFSIVGGTIPAQGSDPTGVTAGYKAGQFPFSLSDDAVKDLIREAAVEDNNVNITTTLNSLVGF